MSQPKFSMPINIPFSKGPNKSVENPFPSRNRKKSYLSDIIVNEKPKNEKPRCANVDCRIANYGSIIHQHYINCDLNSFDTLVDKITKDSKAETKHELVQRQFLKKIRNGLEGRINIEELRSARTNDCYFCRFFNDLEKNNRTVHLHIIECKDPDSRCIIRLSHESKFDTQIKNGQSENFFATIDTYTTECQDGTIKEDCLCSFDRHALDHYYRNDLK